MFSYKPLWKLMIERDMSKSDLQKKLSLSPATIAKMGKNKYVSLEVLDKLCELFDVQPNDIIRYVPATKQEDEAE